MQTTPELSVRPRHARWKPILLLVLVFVLGIAVGVFGGALALRQVLRQKITEGSGAIAIVDRIEQAVIFELDLSASEQAAVAPEFDVTRARVREQRGEIIKLMRENALDTLQRVKAKLPPEKQQRLEQAVHQRLEHWGLLEN